MKFFRKLGFQLVLFFVVAITIPIVCNAYGKFNYNNFVFNGK